MADSVFQGSVVVITGASAGIGLEIARMLAREGASLALAARNPALLGEAAESCRALGAKVLAALVHLHVRAVLGMAPHPERILGRLRERDIWQCDCRCDDQGGEPVMHETFLLWGVPDAGSATERGFVRPDCGRSEHNAR